MKRLLGLVMLLSSPVAASAPAWADGERVLPLAIHVGADVPEAQVDRWVDEASAYFAEAGVAFARVELHRLPPEELVLQDNRARHRFKRRLRPRAINVFIVDTIIDRWPSAATRRAAAREGFEPSGRLGGAHIPAPRHRPGTYVIVRAASMPLVLAHELGHVLGAPHHRDGTNIMSYGRERTHFDDQQRATFARRARRLLRSRDVRRARR